MMTTVGYILAGLNLILTALLAVRRYADDRIEKLKATIRDELDMAYRERVDQSYQSEAEWRNIGETANRSTRLARLHFALLNDYGTVRSAGALLNCSFWVAMTLLIIAIGSVVAATVAIERGVAKNSATAIILVIVVPFCAFVAQSILLGALEHSAKRAHDLTGRYEHKEY
jgi:ABC-type transport system involved in cytochrome bd biosynthesis fused ATPase/permease subunit